MEKPFGKVDVLRNTIFQATLCHRHRQCGLHFCRNYICVRPKLTSNQSGLVAGDNKTSLGTEKSLKLTNIDKKKTVYRNNSKKKTKKILKQSTGHIKLSTDTCNYSIVPKNYQVRSLLCFCVRQHFQLLLAQQA
jgi:hypothetical protein